MKELIKEAKQRSLRGYSTLSKDQLRQLLNGEIVTKKLKKNQRCQDTQTEFTLCQECSLNQELYRLTLKADRRRVVEDNGVIIDIDTGEVLGVTVETSYRNEIYNVIMLQIAVYKEVVVHSLRDIDRLGIGRICDLF